MGCTLGMYMVIVHGDVHGSCTWGLSMGCTCQLNISCTWGCTWGLYMGCTWGVHGDGTWVVIGCTWGCIWGLYMGCTWGCTWGLYMGCTWGCTWDVHGVCTTPMYIPCITLSNFHVQPMSCSPILPKPPNIMLFLLPLARGMKCTNGSIPKFKVDMKTHIFWDKTHQV
jgi:hypothetical protein